MSELIFSNKNVIANYLPDGFIVSEGTDKELLSQIINNTQTSPRQNRYYGDIDRFQNLDTASKWADTGLRTVYSLTRAAELAALITFTDVNHPVESGRSFDIRTYERSYERPHEDILRAFGIISHFANEQDDIRGTFTKVAKGDAPVLDRNKYLGYQETTETDLHTVMARKSQR